MTWVMRPFATSFSFARLRSLRAGVPVSPFGRYLACGLLQRFRARDDLHQLLGDGRLAGAVELEREAADQLLGVARGALHRRHARRVLAGLALEQPAVDRELER